MTLTHGEGPPSSLASVLLYYVTPLHISPTYPSISRSLSRARLSVWARVCCNYAEVSLWQGSRLILSPARSVALTIIHEFSSGVPPHPQSTTHTCDESAGPFVFIVLLPSQMLYEINLCIGLFQGFLQCFFCITKGSQKGNLRFLNLHFTSSRFHITLCICNQSLLRFVLTFMSVLPTWCYLKD